MLARARTGTGKTGCFLIPIIQKLLNSKRVKLWAVYLCMTPVTSQRRNLNWQIGSVTHFPSYCAYMIIIFLYRPNLMSLYVLSFISYVICLTEFSRFFARSSQSNDAIWHTVVYLQVSLLDFILSHSGWFLSLPMFCRSQKTKLYEHLLWHHQKNSAIKPSEI